jgi:hypothetical protein
MYIRGQPGSGFMTNNEKGLESLDVEFHPLFGFDPLGFRMERKQTIKGNPCVPRRIFEAKNK